MQRYCPRRLRRFRYLNGIQIFTRTRRLQLVYVLLLTLFSSSLYIHWRNTRKTNVANLMSSVSCAKLLTNDSGEMEIASGALSMFPSVFPLHAHMVPDVSFVKIAEDCEQFKHFRNYFLRSMSNEEQHFPIAYVIQVYHYVEQFETLLRAIYMPQNVYCIHVDRKANDAVHKGIKAIVNCFKNVFVASKLESVVYASFSRLKADLNCAEDLLERHSKWRYMINLSGEMFPLKTNREIVKILKEFNGINDVVGYRGEMISHHLWRWNMKHRVQEAHPFLSRFSERFSGLKITNLHTPNDPPPHNIEALKGSAFNILSRGCIEYVTHDPIVKDLLRWAESIFSPDEMFWATIQFLKYNPMFKTPGGFTGDLVDNVWSTVFVEWNVEPCKGMNLRDICIPDIRDLPRLASTRELFVNKLLPFDNDPLIFKCLDQILRLRTIMAPPFDTSFYKKHQN